MKGKPMSEKSEKFYRKLDWNISKKIFRRKYFKRRLREFDMYLDLVTPGISKTLAINKSREEDMIQVIKEELRPGMTVIDCGSNIGFYPLLEANILKNDGKIYAIEPDSRNYFILQKNIKQCEYGEIIKSYNIAVSNRTGTSKMFVAEKSNLNKLSSADDDKFSIRHNVQEVVDVKTVTIDEFCKNEGITLDFIRMDIEGFEVEVFQGMKETFENAKSGFMVFLELHPHAYSEQRSFSNEIQKLLDLNYYAKVIISAGEPIPPIFKQLGYTPTKEINSDGFIRGYYDSIPNKDVVELTCGLPKASRYVLLQKK